jgi:hypothetical protein
MTVQENDSSTPQQEKVREGAASGQTPVNPTPSDGPPERGDDKEIHLPPHRGA